MAIHLEPVKIEPPSHATGKDHRLIRWLVAAFLVVSMLLTTAYTVFGGYLVTQLVQKAHLPFTTTPANYHLQFHDVSFTSREDHLQLRGWFIPGVLPDGSLTSQRTIIMVHGFPGNRATESAGMLALANGLVRRGFAVLTFDLRASYESAPAPVSMGLYEQRDVLGAVDFLRSGPLAYPQLGRPQAIVGWGISMGGASLMLAAAREPAIQAIVSDCGYGDLMTVFRPSLPYHMGISSLFALGIFAANRAIYGVDLSLVRPLDVVKKLAPRPVFFIQGDDDHVVPPAQMELLAQTLRSAPGAHVQTWLVTGGVGHGKSFLKAGDVYVKRVADFYTVALAGPAIISASRL